MKNKTQFVCQQCGVSHSKWMGKCQSCGEWNSLVEERAVESKKPNRAGLSGSAPESLGNIKTNLYPRITSGCGELDNVLGGGLVPGSAVLLGGEPGIGKSTLLLQSASFFANQGMKVLYASGEESTSQIALRAKRLGVDKSPVRVISESNLEAIRHWIDQETPELLVIDSIQTIASDEFESQPGTVGQIRECAHQLITLGKSRNMSVILVGHVTKDGSIAGPKVLEHMVDAVLYFEGTSNHMFRILRSIKNRFGSTNEIGVFEMRDKGVTEVKNPSELFLSERSTSQPGSSVTAALEGSRPLLIEIQALVSRSGLAIPRRTAIGLDPNRVSLLVAILEKRAGFRLYDQDVYVNVAGGIRVSEPATDLATVAALVSSSTGKICNGQSIFLGEVGLGGEIRSVPRMELRLGEAKKIGFHKAFVPKRMLRDLEAIEKMELVGLDHVGELTDFIG